APAGRFAADDGRAAAFAGLAIATEYAEAEALAVIHLQVVAHAGTDAFDAARAIAVARDGEQGFGETRALFVIQVPRPSRRLDAGGKQHFGAQVVAHAGHESLIEQQRGQRSTTEARAE